MRLSGDLYEVLKDTVQTRRPTSYLEIGVSDGKSLKEVLKYDSFCDIKKITLVDEWGNAYGGSGKGNHDHIIPSLGEESWTDIIEFKDGNSHDVLPTINSKFDMILVDGDHSDAGCLQDMEDSWKLLNPGGVMLVDDIVHPAHRGILAVCYNFVMAHKREVETAEFFTEKSNGVAVIVKEKEGVKERAVENSVSKKVKGK